MHPIDPLLQSNPDIMKPTRMLLIDHDVCRFHSLDLLFWLLYKDAIANDPHFHRLKEQYKSLLDSDLHIGDKAMLYATTITDLNPHKCFNDDTVELELPEYEKLLNEMMLDPVSKVTRTEVNNRLGIIFERKDITGFMVRYANDRNIPYYADKLTVYESDNLFDLDYLCKIIIKERINAIMLSTIDYEVLLSAELQRRGYTDHITFMVGQYGYNYDFVNGKPLYPHMTDVTLNMELAFKNEYGFFDPFTSISERHHFDTYSNRKEPAMHLPDVSTMPGLGG